MLLTATIPSRVVGLYGNSPSRMVVLNRTTPSFCIRSRPSLIRKFSDGGDGGVSGGGIDSAPLSGYTKKPEPRIMTINHGKIYINEPAKPPSTFSLPQFDLGMTRFLKRVYTYTGVGICASLGVSYFTVPFAAANPLGTILMGAVLSFGSLYPLSYFKPNYKQVQENNQIIKYAEDDNMRYLSFGALVTGMGMIMSPAMMMCMAVDPMIVPTAFVMSSMVFGGCALYSTKCKDETMMKWQGPLMVGLYSLVGLGLTSIASLLIFGPNPYAALMMNVDTYGGLLLFVGLSIYDSHTAIKMYKENKPDHIECATILYLDFMNLMIRIMEIMKDMKKK